MNSLKTVLLSIFLLFLIFSAAASEKLVYADLHFTSRNGINNDKIAGQAVFQFSNSNMDFTAGIQGSELSHQFTSNGTWWFIPSLNLPHPECTKIKIGASGIVNAENYSEISFRNNAYAGIKSRFYRGNHFSAGSEFYFGYQLSKLYELEDIDPLFYHEYAAEIDCEFYFTENLTMRHSLSSYELFFYPRFFAPTYSVEWFYKANRNLFFYTKSSFRTIDLFTLSAHLDCITADFAIGYRF